jgi:hypothetical protein
MAREPSRLAVPATGRRGQHYNALCLIDGLIALAGEHAPIPGTARSSPRSTPSRGCTIVRSKRKVVSSRMASKRGEPGRREKRSPAGSLASPLAGRSAIAAPAIGRVAVACRAGSASARHKALRTHAERGFRFLPSRKNCIPMPVRADTCPTTARPVPGPIARSSLAAVSRTFGAWPLKNRLAGKGEAVADLAWI